jgi:hypothetical protein
VFSIPNGSNPRKGDTPPVLHKLTPNRPPAAEQRTLAQTGSRSQSDRKRFSPTYQETPAEREEKRTEQRARRWNLQREARRLMPKEAITHCNRTPIPTRDEITIHEHNEREGRTRFYAGLRVCASVWMCPICAAKITERRRQELTNAIKEADKQGLSIYFATYTFSHHQREPLQDNLTRFKDARHAVKSGRWAKDHKQKYQIAGAIEVLEVTYGHSENGWHPHTHELIFTEQPADLEQLSHDLRSKWEHEAARHGLSMNVHGFELTATRGAIADYIAKWGHEPKSDPWGAEAELSKGHLKKGRGMEDAHLSPFGILQAISDGHTELEPVFIEYCTAFKGRHQLQWTPGLKKRLNVEEKTDKELAEEQTEHADEILALSSAHAWPIVKGNDYIRELLELPDAATMRDTLIGLGVDPKYIRLISPKEAQVNTGGGEALLDTDEELLATDYRKDAPDAADIWGAALERSPQPEPPPRDIGRYAGTYPPPARACYICATECWRWNGSAYTCSTCHPPEAATS